MSDEILHSRTGLDGRIHPDWYITVDVLSLFRAAQRMVTENPNNKVFELCESDEARFSAAVLDRLTSLTACGGIQVWENYHPSKKRYTTMTFGVACLDDESFSLWTDHLFAYSALAYSTHGQKAISVAGKTHDEAITKFTDKMFGKMRDNILKGKDANLIFSDDRSVTGGKAHVAIRPMRNYSSEQTTELANFLSRLTR